MTVDKNWVLIETAAHEVLETIKAKRSPSALRTGNSFKGGLEKGKAPIKWNGPPAFPRAYAKMRH